MRKRQDKNVGPRSQESTAARNTSQGEIVRHFWLVASTFWIACVLFGWFVIGPMLVTL